MIRTILIDDEEHCLYTLNILLSEYCPKVQVMASCDSVVQALDQIDKLKPDLVFLDIEMPFMNGFEMLEKIKPISFSVIFTTSYHQYAIRAIQYSALDYLLKPIDPKALLAAIHRVEQQKMKPSAEQFQILLDQLSQKEKRFSKIAIPTTEGFELIPADQVVHCKADDNFTIVYLKNKSTKIACRSLKDMEEQLNDFNNFVRVHNSHMVNMNEVSKYVRGEGGYLVMTDGSTINVSRARKEALLKYF
jgi:two-component system, LytTR family, response regulator